MPLYLNDVIYIYIYISIYMPRHFNNSTNFNVVNPSSVQISNFIWELNWRVSESFHKVKAFKFHYFCEFSLSFAFPVFLSLWDMELPVRHRQSSLRLAISLAFIFWRFHKTTLQLCLYFICPCSYGYLTAIVIIWILVFDLECEPPTW